MTALCPAIMSLDSLQKVPGTLKIHRRNFESCLLALISVSCRLHWRRPEPSFHSRFIECRFCSRCLSHYQPRFLECEEYLAHGASVSGRIVHP